MSKSRLDIQAVFVYIASFALKTAKTDTRKFYANNYLIIMVHVK